MTKRMKLEFPGRQGQRLAAALEIPPGPARAWAIFAHCFTCGKDSVAASRISRTLAASGIGTLRFDFTGIGASEGDFANTQFTSNVDDLVAAADYLRAHHGPPELLVGHSLGGTAVLAAAEAIDDARAIVTIGSPASPRHLLQHATQTRDEEGRLLLDIAGTTWPLDPGFAEDLSRDPLADRIGRLRKALLVLHAPLDDVVGIDEAGAIFQAARHPKSFVSLDGADHLLRRLADAQYVADLISAWASRYLASTREPAAGVPAVAAGEVLVTEENHQFLQQVTTDQHHWLADEPVRVGGSDLGPDPYEHLLAALGTCTAMTLRMYATRKSLPLRDVQVRLRHDREHRDDCADCEQSNRRVDVLTREIHLQGELSEQERKRLLEIADRCPVHRTLEGPLDIRTIHMPD